MKLTIKSNNPDQVLSRENAEIFLDGKKLDKVSKISFEIDATKCESLVKIQLFVDEVEFGNPEIDIKKLLGAPA